MRGPRSIATACMWIAAILCAAGAASAGIVAFTGETHHRQPPDPLIDFGEGRVVSLVPYMAALGRHVARDDEIVLVLLETGGVVTAEDSLASLLLYAEDGLGRDVGKLVREPGSVLLFETPAGSSDPRAATLARLAEPRLPTHRLHLDPGAKPLPEPGPLAGLSAGAALLHALRRSRRPRVDPSTASTIVV